MASSMWKRTLHFLGLVEDYEDEFAEVPAEPGQAPMMGAPPVDPALPRPEQSNVRRIPPAGGPQPPGQPGMFQPAPVGGGMGMGALPGGVAGGPMAGTSAPSTGPSASVRTVSPHSVHLTNPSTFNDVEEVGERFRGGTPVIMNLQGASEGVAKRLLDFASGLIYGLDGRIERVGDRVFLLTPMGVDVSTEERARLSERGFFNQA